MKPGSVTISAAESFSSDPGENMSQIVFYRQLHKVVAVGVLVIACWPVLATAQAYFDRYGLVAKSPVVDLGIQPLGYPSGVISAVMQHDRILKAALAQSGQPLKTHPFRRGADMVALLADHRLEAGLLGDMPTILAAATANVWVVGLVKQTFTAIVVKGDTHVRGLAGKRIGIVEASSAHHTLLQALASAGLNESQVKLVALGVDEMPDALARGDIDAFAAWEPAPTIALSQSAKVRIVSRGLSTDYFVIDQYFEKQSPETARQLVAGFVRAIQWMRRSQHNVEKATIWAMADAQALSGKVGTLSVAQIASITKREILNIPSAPAILKSPGSPPLKKEFLFLADLGKMPPGGTWDNVETAFTYDGLARVMADPRRYQLATFDYED
jgi:ABC-type nitrate/sulfonate/bicarbonate transport system substrate-binding protein